MLRAILLVLSLAPLAGCATPVVAKALLSPRRVPVPRTTQLQSIVACVASHTPSGDVRVWAVVRDDERTFWRYDPDTPEGVRVERPGREHLEVATDRATATVDEEGWVKRYPRARARDSNEARSPLVVSRRIEGGLSLFARVPRDEGDVWRELVLPDPTTFDEVERPPSAGHVLLFTALLPLSIVADVVICVGGPGAVVLLWCVANGATFPVPTWHP